MFQLLSHPLDPAGYAWPGEPVVKTRQCTDVNEVTPFCSFVSELPNHCGTHMDAPRHFVRDGKSINELSLDYFCHSEVALIDVPKEAVGGVTKEDLEPYADIIGKVSFLLIRTGFEQYRETNQDLYQNKGPYIATSAGKYLTDNFPNLKGIGVDFLAVGTPSPDVPEGENPMEVHRNLLGYYTGRFVTAVEDMHLSDLPAGKKITRFFNAPLLIVGLDSSQVTCIAEIED